MLDPVGGDVLECGEGHEDTMDQVVPPVDLQFAVDVLDDTTAFCTGSAAPNTRRIASA